MTVSKDGLDFVVALSAKRKADDGGSLRDPEPGMNVLIEAHYPGHPVQLSEGVAVKRGLQFPEVLFPEACAHIASSWSSQSSVRRS